MCQKGVAGGTPRVRETVRHHSFIAPVAVGQIVGLGVRGDELALQAALEIVGRD